MLVVKNVPIIVYIFHTRSSSKIIYDIHANIHSSSEPKESFSYIYISS